MKKLILTIFSVLSAFAVQAQDLNCTVDVVTNSIQITNKQIFDDLKNAVTQFMNNRKWISDQVAANEKIDCNLVIEVSDFSVSKFKANFNIQSSRTVYNSTYNTKILSYVDNSVVFEYAQYQAMEFQESSFSGNLTSVLAFYAYIIVGLDFDTFELKGGDPYFRKAQAIRDAAMNSADGWNSNYGNGSRNRYFLIDNLLDSRFASLRTAMYRYHIKGLDNMTKDIEAARKEVYQSIKDLKIVHDALPNAFFLKLFFNAKTEEVIQIFSKATPTLKNKVVELLSRMDPSNRSRYEDGILKSGN
jgi:Domain of unknown function (DUF4835)